MLPPTPTHTGHRKMGRSSREEPQTRLRQASAATPGKSFKCLGLVSGLRLENLVNLEKVKESYEKRFRVSGLGHEKLGHIEEVEESCKMLPKKWFQNGVMHENG